MESIIGLVFVIALLFSSLSKLKMQKGKQNNHETEDPMEKIERSIQQKAKSVSIPSKNTALDSTINDPRNKTFTKPDVHCVTCENTGIDHFENDRQKRLKQLDQWLSSGIIDKKEYAILKKRYMENN